MCRVYTLTLPERAKLAQIQVLRVSLRDVTWNLSSGNLTMTVEDQTNAEGQMHFT